MEIVGNYVNINYGSEEWNILKNKLEKEVDQLKRTKIYVKKCIQFSLYKINDIAENKLDDEVGPKMQERSWNNLIRLLRLIQNQLITIIRR